MISVNEARKILSENSEQSEQVAVVLQNSLGRIVAKDVFAPIDVPSFNNSAMDGYAMEFEGQNEWELDGIIQAGDTSTKEVKTGKAVRIFTGAKMPEGADTVIQQELIERNDKTGIISYHQDKIKKGSNVRSKGSQCKKGELILKSGTKITPGVIGLLASVGIAEVDIFNPPSVGFIITGDELKEVGSQLKEGEIYNSNGPMLEALLSNIGINEMIAYKASDDKEELQQRVDEALEKHDVLLLSGGISIGDYDFVKECLENSGVKELFYKLKQRPGKPMFAGKKNNKWIFALPGNPASVLSCFNQFVKPSLKIIMGHENVWKPDSVLPLEDDFSKKFGFTFFLKGRIENDKLALLAGQQSFNLLAFSTANCLVELDEESEMVKAGTPVKIYKL